MNGAVDGLEEPPEDGGGGVAEDRAVPAGETAELPAFQTSRDRVLPDPNRAQLRHRDHPVLPRGKFRHGQIEPVTLLPHVEE